MRQMPGGQGLKIVGQAFRRAGVSADRVEAFHRSITGYREMVERHAGDAATLETMLGSRQDDPVFAEEALKLRKQAFRGAAAVWGAQARVKLAMTVVSPTHGDDELLDLGSLLGYIDFRRLRQSALWPVHQGQMSTDAGTAIGSWAGRSMVPQFCSTPVPELDEFEHGDQKVFAIQPGPVGKTRLLTWMVEAVMPAAVSRYRDAENEFGHHDIGVRMPVELLQHDLLIHSDLSFDLPPEVALYQDTGGMFEIRRRVPDDRLELPITEKVVSLGSQPPIMSTPHVPGVTEMAAYLCERVGRDLDEFTGYRFSMPYPPMPTVLFLSHPLMTR